MMMMMISMATLHSLARVRCCIMQEWTDMRMTWDPDDFNNLNVLRIPANKLWLPDIVLYNK